MCKVCQSPKRNMSCRECEDRLHVPVQEELDRTIKAFDAMDANEREQDARYNRYIIYTCMFAICCAILSIVATTA